MSQIKKKLDKESVVKMGKGAAIAAGGVALLYILEALLSIDFGPYTPLAVAILSVLINSTKEWLAGV